MARDLTGFIPHLKENYPEDLLEIGRTVRPQQYEVTAILEHLTRANRFPLVEFASPCSIHGQVSDCSLVSNVFATRERCATALGYPREESKMPLSLEFARRQTQSVAAEVVPKRDAPVKDIVEAGEQADLGKLPIVRHYEMDIGPYVTMACVMRDPDEVFYDVSFVKSLYRGPRKRDF